jgi:pimeloyl-ACP methyl ester carboxylesterase
MAIARPETTPAPLVAHRIAGRGVPLLLLNGGLMSMAAWEPVAGPLEERFRVVRCDLRGQLLSPGDPPAEFGGHVADLVSLLDALGLEAVHVVGTSFGAAVGLLLAARSPERVLSLAAVAATDRITGESWAATRPVLEAARDAARGGDGGRVFELLAPGTFSPRYAAAHAEALAARRARVTALPRGWFEGLAGLLSSLEGLDLRPELGRIRCPALIVAAEHDLSFPLERSESLAAAIPGAELVVVPDSGHALVVEAPERLAAVLMEFLARSGQKGAFS